MMVKLLDDLKRGHFPECIWRIHFVKFSHKSNQIVYNKVIIIKNQNLQLLITNLIL